MSTWIRNNPIKLISVGLLVLFLGLNCFGFCFGQMRFLSDQERIEIVVKNELRSYMRFEGTQIHWPLAEYGTAEYLKQTTVGTTEYFDYIKTSLFGKPIPYKDIEEFFKQNPNCCEVVRDLRDGEGLHQVSIFGCLTGHAPYLVRVKYLVNYTDKEGVVKSAPVSGFYKISSCGAIKDFLD